MRSVPTARCTDYHRKEYYLSILALLAMDWTTKTAKTSAIQACLQILPCLHACRRQCGQKSKEDYSLKTIRLIGYYRLRTKVVVATA